MADENMKAMTLPEALTMRGSAQLCAMHAIQIQSEAEQLLRKANEAMVKAQEFANAARELHRAKGGHHG